MATNIINEFSQFNLSESEQLSGQQLNSMQRLVLQNLRAEYAIKKINLAYDPINQQQYLQQEAEISGWLSCLTYILECDIAAKSLLLEQATGNDPESSGDAITVFQ